MRIDAHLIENIVEHINLGARLVRSVVQSRPQLLPLNVPGSGAGKMIEVTYLDDASTIFSTADRMSCIPREKEAITTS